MPPFTRQVFIYVDISLLNVKYLDNIIRNYELESLILYSECVTCNDILKQGLEELHFTE
jgi:hypothetical protein